jgi:hypothetical protein
VTRAIVCALAIGLARVAFANAPSDYAYVFPIEAKTTGDASAWRIELTPEVYRYVQDASLRDVEIFNADGKPVPMARIAVEAAATLHEERAALALLELPATTTAASSDLRLVIDRDADGRLRRIDAGEGARDAKPSRDWLVDASAFDRAIETLTLAWREPASGVVARFAVDASDDFEHWRDIATGTVLALEQSGAKLERRDIALGGVKAKYLRLRRLDDGVAIAGLGVDARSIERGRAAPARVWIEASPTASQTDANAPLKGARYDYALTAPLPVETARIELRNDNALAEIQLLARATEAESAPWQHVARLTAFRLRQGDEPLRNGDVDLTAARRVRDFRIESATTIAEAPKLSLAYRPDAFVFLAEGSAPFVLAAGSVGARRPDYPVEPALASLRASLGKDWQPPLVSLGASKASAGDAALRAPPPPLPWRRWLLWGVLMAGAALIAALSLSLLRGAKRGE